MKTTMIVMAAFLFSLNIQAQNQNVKSEVKTTVTTTKDSEGEKKLVKKQEVQEVQNVELKDAESRKINKEMKETPVQVTSVTQVTNPDGSTRTVGIDRSSYYTYNGKRYKVVLDAEGYTISSDDNKKAGLLRKTSTNSFIYRTKDKTAIGYFDTNGNLILETYDDKSDKVTIETFEAVKK